MTTAQKDPLGPRGRDAVSLPSSGNGLEAPPGAVLICHPGYDEERVILRLLAYSKDNGRGPWVDYNFAHDMCMAVTGNVHPGHFTLTRAADSPKVGVEERGLVASEKYFFHLPETQYAVVRSFRDLRFSPEHVPAHWRKACPSMTREADHVSESCCVSGEDMLVQDAHLIPSTEWGFWTSQNLHSYAIVPAPTTLGREMLTRSNMIRLAANLHLMFDAAHFVLIPGDDGIMQCQWIRRSDQMALKYHKRKIRGGVHVVSPEYAYLACVYRVMVLMQESFLKTGAPMTLVMTKDGKQIQMTGSELIEYIGNEVRNTNPTKSGSRDSLKKRLRGEEGSDSDSESGVDVTEFTRGRPRTKDLEDLIRSNAKRRKLVLASEKGQDIQRQMGYDG
ncbi:hypothetical protein FH972_024052 [Carpinus fangiana]|uniref:HNH nuclease domain-containing protein n=1 Tax=Carpinus fangiana TaxID=176857 RepID=A0A5N6KZE3_9ROSI|nr:hypothetical protein FH972_024052 [Carpinus fangiana]